MRILGERVLQEQSWTVLKEKRYLDNEGRKKRWTYIERRERREAAVVVATTEQSGSLVLIEQLRIPFGVEIFEFPAGLINQGETPAQTAVRELSQETGFTGRVLHVGPGVSSTSGLSTEIIYMVYMLVDEVPAADPQLDDSEQIRVFTLRPREIGDFLDDCVRNNRILDAKLYTYLRTRVPGEPQ